MALVAGITAGPDLCRDLGIDPRNVVAVFLEADAQQHPVLTVRRFTLEDGPPGPPADATGFTDEGFRRSALGRLKYTDERVIFGGDLDALNRALCEAVGLPYGVEGAVRSFRVVVEVDGAVRANVLRFVHDHQLAAAVNVLRNALPDATRRQPEPAEPPPPDVTPGGMAAAAGVAWPAPRDQLRALALAVWQGDAKAALVLADMVRDGYLAALEEDPPA